MKIGLSEKESEFYLMILRHDGISASQISRIRNESRTHVYDTLTKLLEKSLINYVVKNNVKFFRAVNPEKIFDYLKEKEFQIKKQEEEINEILPELIKLKESHVKDDFDIQIYEGKEGIKNIMVDILKEGKSFVTWGATTKVKDYLPDFFIDKYLNERKRKKIKAKQLFTDFYGVLKSPLSENRKLPKEFATPTTTAVYGDKVSIWIWSEIPKVILIKNKDLAKSYKKHFDLMWEKV